MRAFIALELPEKVKKEIAKLQKQLQRAGAKATWVKPEIAHLTFAFLGSVTHNEVEIIHKILEKEVKKSSLLKLELGLVSCFPSPERARIIFIDLQGDLKKLNYLVKQIRKNLNKQKIWFDDKPFVAHATLGRVRKRQNLTHILKGVKIEKIEFLGQEITLNQSTLGHSGPKYTQLKICHLT
jgi:2'-5' RNA ligase